MTFQDTRNYRVRSEKARRVLGFSPTHSIDEGIEEIKALLEMRRIKNISNVRYTNDGYLAKFGTHL